MKGEGSLFSVAPEDKTWSNGFKFQERWFHLNIMENLLTELLDIEKCIASESGGLSFIGSF